MAALAKRTTWIINERALLFIGIYSIGAGWMIVEFVGSTGAGKTTLISEIKQRLSKKVSVSSPYHMIARRFGMQNITHPTVQNLLQEFIGFPFFLRSLHRHRDFALYTLGILARQSSFNIFTINNLRSFERKMGVFEINKQKNHNRIILVDEGTVLLAHNLFVFNQIQFSSEQISKFASLVPLPDILIYVRAPIDQLVSRSLQRGNPPRELKNKTQDSVENYINRAVLMFEELVSFERIRSRTLTVENPNSISSETGSIADNICEFVLQQVRSNN
jgi:thymidylate kinase